MSSCACFCDERGCETCCYCNRSFEKADNGRMRDLEAKLKVATEALMGLKRGQGYCWCDVAIGNPMMANHTPQCLQAMRAFGILEDN